MELDNKKINAYMVARSAQPDQLILELGGSLNIHSIDSIWRQARKAFKKLKPKMLVLETQNIVYCDASGISFLIWLKRMQQKNNAEFIIEGLRDEYRNMLRQYEPKLAPLPPKEDYFKDMVEDIGFASSKWAHSLKNQISFLGQTIYNLAKVITKPSDIRIKEIFFLSETSGANAFGIVSLIGFLFGVILGFQSAVPMKMFGVEIYVADLVALSMLRVLGPFIAAMLYCARSGTAFAAELGTMKVNEEIDALTTLGINITNFLVVPRVISAIFMIPLLTICVIFFGLFGTGIVMSSLGYAPVTYINELISAVDLGDFLGGYIKSFIFGFIVSTVGCYCGLKVKADPRSVGKAATDAVVNGVILVVIAEGIISVLYFYMGI